MRCKVDEVRILENNLKSIMLSDLWRYAIALGVSPEILIVDGRETSFSPGGNGTWLADLERRFKRTDWEAGPDGADALCVSISSILEQIAAVKEAFALGYSDPSIADLDAAHFEGPFHCLAENFSYEGTKIHILARDFCWTELQVLHKIRPETDMNVEEFERLALKCDVPLRILLRGAEADDPYVIQSRTVLRLGKCFRQFSEIVSDADRPAAEVFIKDIAAAIEVDPDEICGFPKVGQRRSKDEASPLEEKSIPDFFPPGGFDE
jgi:hypothetical protein